MENPYAGINWKTVLRVGSATHLHATNQDALNNGYTYGIRHFPISNYYPSAPYDADTKPSDFRIRQHWPARRDGKLLDPPINWNDIITWQDELEEPYRSEFPFREGGPAFTDIPGDAILSPNAEHHGFSNSRSHICSPGSSFSSGNFDLGGRRFRLAAHGFSVGFGGTWQECFGGILEQLNYPDAGGIVICHPTWFSHLPDALVYEMLDFDDRVMGIEIYNDYSGRKNWSQIPNYQPPSEGEAGFSTNLWDRILATGRRCWGFSVPDHSVHYGKDWLGRCVLLVAEFTEHACLKAYRQGQFYACLKDNGLTIRDFWATGSGVSVSVSTPARIKFITEAGLVATVEGEQARYDLPQKKGRPSPIYIRVEVEDDAGERLFLQPVSYNGVHMLSPAPNKFALKTFRWIKKRIQL